MAEKRYAQVVPEMLRWAREEAGYTVDEVATRLSVAKERIASWEDGNAAPTVPQARRLAETYGRSLSVFYLPAPPPRAKLPKDFRRSYGEPRRVSSRLRYELRQALYRRDLALELFDELEETPASFDLHADLGERPVEVATRVRATLGIDIDTQLAWKTNNDAYRAWRSATEARGIFVFQTGNNHYDVAVDEMRGVALYHPIVPIIIVNGRDSATGRIFSLMHELIHLALHTEGLCDQRDDEAGIEVFCNAIAGEILVPTTTLMTHVHQVSPGRDKWTDDMIRTLSDYFCVSRDVAARRLYAVGEISQAFYHQKHLQYTEDYQVEKEAKRQTIGNKTIIVPVFRRQLLQYGHPYSELVVDAYRLGLITVSDACRRLGVTHPHLSDIENALNRA